MPAGSTPFPFGDCRVCNDRATGVHYGVATCEGCKGFFKRSIPKADKYKCFFGSQCVLSPQNRNRCKACRFQRCISVGMSVDAVKMGRIPKVDKERALAETSMGWDSQDPPSTLGPSSQPFSSYLPQYNNTQPIDTGRPGFASLSSILYQDIQQNSTDQRPHTSSEDSGISHGATSPDSDLQSLTSSDTNVFDSGVADWEGKEHFRPNGTRLEPFLTHSQVHGNSVGVCIQQRDPLAAQSPTLTTPVNTPVSSNSPFSPNIIKELITQVIESGHGRELQQTLLKQFFSGNTGAGASRAHSAEDINSFMSSLEDWNSKQNYADDAGSKQASFTPTSTVIKTEMDCESSTDLLSDLIGEIPPPLPMSKPSSGLSEPWSLGRGAPTADMSCDTSRAVNMSASMPGSYPRHSAGSLLDLDADLLKLSSSVPETLNHQNQVETKPRVIMPIAGMTAGVQDQTAVRVSEDSAIGTWCGTSNSAAAHHSNGSHIVDNGCHENVQVDLNEFDQYLFPNHKQRMSPNSNSLYPNEHKNIMDGSSAFVCEEQQNYNPNYLNTRYLLPSTSEEVLNTMSRLEGAGRSFREDIQRNLRLMREEKSGDRMPHPINTVTKAKKHQVAFVWNQLMESIPICNINVLGLCRDVPQFCDLDPKDQAILMEDAYFDIWLTMSACLLNNGDSYLRLPCNGRYSRWWMHYFLPKCLVDSMFHYAEELNKCQLTQSETITICAIQLANPARSGLTQEQEVRRLHNLYLSVLSGQLLHRHNGNSHSVLTRVLQLLPMLGPLNKEQAEVVGKFKVESPPEGVLKYSEEDDEPGSEFD